jgi:hypothetical protein
VLGLCSRESPVLGDGSGQNSFSAGPAQSCDTLMQLASAGFAHSACRSEDRQRAGLITHRL